MKNRTVSFFSNGSVGVFIAAAIGAAILMWVSGVAVASISSGNLATASSTQVTTTNVTINKPSTATGDVMLATIAVHGGSSVVVSSVPSGWTPIRRTDNDANLTLLSYWKAASSSEPGSYQWTFEKQTTAEGAIVAYSGVDSNDPIDTSADNTGLATSATTSAITTSAASSTIVALFAVDEGKSNTAGSYFGAATGMTEKTNSDVSNTPFGPSIAIDEATQATAGTFTSKTAAIGGNNKAKNWATQVIALRPVAIQYDAESSNFSSSPGTSITTSHTVAGSNTVLFASVTTTCTGPGDVVTGVTYNGTAMTQAGKVAIDTGTPGGYSYLYYLFAPASGTHDIVVSYSSCPGYVYVANASYKNVSQSGLDAVGTSSAHTIGSSISGTVTTIADGDWVVMGSHSGDGNTSAGSGTTIRATSPTLDRQLLSDSGGPKHPAGSVTLTVNGNNDYITGVTAAIVPLN